MQEELKELSSPTSDILLTLVKFNEDSATFARGYLSHVQLRMGRKFEPGEGNIYTGLGHYAQLIKERISFLRERQHSN